MYTHVTVPTVTLTILSGLFRRTGTLSNHSQESIVQYVSNINLLFLPESIRFFLYSYTQMEYHISFSVSEISCAHTRGKANIKKEIFLPSWVRVMHMKAAGNDRAEVDMLWPTLLFFSGKER